VFCLTQGRNESVSEGASVQGKHLVERDECCCQGHYAAYTASSSQIPPTKSLAQECQAPGLEGRFPAGFRCLPALTPLIQINASLAGVCRT